VTVPQSGGIVLTGSIHNLKITVNIDDRDDNCYTHLTVRKLGSLLLLLVKCVRYSDITRKYKCMLGFGEQRRTVSKLLFN
jgi:hypothetical protein